MSGTVDLARPGEQRNGHDLSLGEVVSIRFTADDIEELNKLVQREGRFASSIVRAALREYIVRARRRPPRDPSV